VASVTAIPSGSRVRVAKTAAAQKGSNHASGSCMSCASGDSDQSFGWKMPSMWSGSQIASGSISSASDSACSLYAIGYSAEIMTLPKTQRPPAYTNLASRSIAGISCFSRQ
jgi:hypothetical protein